MESNPDSFGSADFHDVDSNKWYANGIAWAAENGIITGNSDGSYMPDSPIIREQLAVMLWRYAGSPASKRKLSSTFDDAMNISDYAREAMNWAVENGIMQGSGGKLDPKGNATRAHAAQMLKNFLENLK